MDDRPSRWFIACVCIFALSVVVAGSYCEYLNYRLDIQAIEAGYEQKVEGTKVIWTKTNIEKVEQQ
jgi:hypothetical protein